MPSSSDRRSFLWLLLVVSSLAAIGLFFIPALIIQPFKHQSAAGLSWAMEIRQRSPWGTLAAALVCLPVALALWRRSTGPIGSSNKWRNRSRKAGLVVVMMLVVFSTVMARLNYFEWMFHPVKSAQFDSEAASKLDQGEMVLAVKFGDDARAYPIREMAYHHILNDDVNGVPIAVTY
jgi:hypothetical protein